MNAPRMRGMSLIDVIVGSALMLIMFVALLGVLRASLLVSSLAKAKAGATAIAQTQMEYLRGLSYDSLGTVGGIPNGSVPEYATTTIDNTAYATHTFVSYVDDPADGLGASDTNGITTDYKRAEVTIDYVVSSRTNEVQLVSNFAPPGIETTVGGGTLLVRAVDATGAPVSGATVAITNSVLSPTVNLTAYSNTDGQVYLPGAATSSSYQVTVSKAGYSSAQTYARDATNQNPNPGYLTVSANQTTTGTFAIDHLSAFALTTFSPVATSTFTDSFADTSRLLVLASTTVSGGVLTLATSETSGSALSVATTSTRLASWGELIATTSTPTDTSLVLHIYDSSGLLVPDSVLSGNAAGFTTFPVPLYGISTTTYPSLSIGADFATTGGSAASVSAWSLSYTEGPLPLPNAAFTLTGAKIKGTTGAGAPLYKTTLSATTGGDGTQGATLEWDTYALTTPGTDIVDACPAPPYTLSPASTTSATLTLVPTTGDSLRVFVTDASGAAMAGATVTVTLGLSSETLVSSLCGFAYTGAVSDGNTYTVTISKLGYTTTSKDVPIADQTTTIISFP